MLWLICLLDLLFVSPDLLKDILSYNDVQDNEIESCFSQRVNHNAKSSCCFFSKTQLLWFLGQSIIILMAEMG